jgi:methyl-accepting chemotaxis protein
MKLLTKLLISTIATVVLITAVSEWLSHRTTMRFLDGHAQEMNHAPASAESSQPFEERARRLGNELTAIHVVHALVAVSSIVVVLTLFWTWMVIRPIQAILDQMNRLSRCVSYKHLEPRCLDEIGQMAIALNQLGDRLTESLGDAMNASELSALSLLGQTIVRKVTIARDQLATTLTLLSAASRSNVPAPPSTATTLAAVIDRLGAISEHFEHEFDKRLREKRTQAMRDAYTNDDGGTSSAIATSPFSSRS